MPIPCNGVCCNYSVAPAYQSVKHNISGFSGLVQVERRFSDTGCNSWHCFLKGQTSLLRFNVRYSIECLFIISSWGDGAAYNNDRHGIQQLFVVLPRDFLVAIHGIIQCYCCIYILFLRISHYCAKSDSKLPWDRGCPLPSSQAT